jgi:hypothetical protein
MGPVPLAGDKPSTDGRGCPPDRRSGACWVQIFDWPSDLLVSEEQMRGSTDGGIPEHRGHSEGGGLLIEASPLPPKVVMATITKAVIPDHTFLPLLAPNRETMTAQYGRNARLRDDDTEFLELADDTEIAPPGVLSCQAPDQRHRLFGKGWTTRSAVRVGPAPTDKRAVPAEDGLWRDEERTPAFRGTRPARRATRARSDQVKRGRAIWRRSTATWCRSTRISASFAAASDQWTRTTWRTRQTRR